MICVLDASVTLSWCFKDDLSPYAVDVLKRVAHAQAIVPSIWPAEVANALLVGERRQRLTKADIARVNSLLLSLPICIDQPKLHEAIEPVLVVAREHGLSAYDATYLELAMRQGCPLATLDQRLLNASEAAGVELVAG